MPYNLMESINITRNSKKYRIEYVPFFVYMFIFQPLNVFFPATLDQQGVATDDFQTSVLSGKLLYYVYTSIVEPIWIYSVVFFLI